MRFPTKVSALTLRRAINSAVTDSVPEITPKDHFALEMGHMAKCEDTTPSSSWAEEFVT